MSLESEIAIEAKDLLPETWRALANAGSFGMAALERRHDRVVSRIFNSALSDEDIEALPGRVIEYAGKRLALALIDPAIDYWSKQIISHTAGERESSAYKDRVEDLKQLKKDWILQLADDLVDVQPLLPVFPVAAQDAPRVVQIGTIEQHVTADPFDIESIYGPPEEIAGT
jgi:hypothetical protein